MGIENPVEEKDCSCQECAKRAQVEAAQEEMNFALLLALLPLMVVTLFGQMGLF